MQVVCKAVTTTLRFEEDDEIERYDIQNIILCEVDAAPAFEDTAAARNKVAEGVRKDHSETCSSEADSSAESEF